MKKIILSITILFAVNTIAQTPIINFADRNGTIVPGAYYKDNLNLLNQYEGTWLYTNGNTTLKIVLVKKQMKKLGRIYEDILIGEYQYIENGVEKFNSLADLNTPHTIAYDHNIVGNHITKRPPYPGCLPGEKFLDLSFEDNISAKISVRKIMVGSQRALEIDRELITIMDPLGSNIPITPIVPLGTIYVLIKQP